MGGGGFVDGIIFHPTAKNLMYARTDVGGAYRWDDQKQEWIPLTDWLSSAQGNFTGIESIALDPSDANRVYLAAGTYMNNPAAILRSDDQGRTFKITEVPFRMGGNSEGRSSGERLAVDPNQGAIYSSARAATGCGKAPTMARLGRGLRRSPTSARLNPPPLPLISPQAGGVAVSADFFSAATSPSASSALSSTRPADIAAPRRR